MSKFYVNATSSKKTASSKKAVYNFSVNELLDIFTEKGFVDWFEKFKDLDITTEIYDKEKRLARLKTKELSAVEEKVRYSLLGEPKPKRTILNRVCTSFKYWTTEEEDIIIKNNPDLTHSKAVIEELALLLPDRTLEAISERVKILRHLTKYNVDEEDKNLVRTWTIEQENFVYGVVSKEEQPTSYDLAARLSTEPILQDKGIQNIRGKIREILNLK